MKSWAVPNEVDEQSHLSGRPRDTKCKISLLGVRLTTHWVEKPVVHVWPSNASLDAGMPKDLQLHDQCSEQAKHLGSGLASFA